MNLVRICLAGSLLLEAHAKDATFRVPLSLTHPAALSVHQYLDSIPRSGQLPLPGGNH